MDTGQRYAGVVVGALEDRQRGDGIDRSRLALLCVQRAGSACHAARRRDEGEAVTMLASCCKLFATEMVGRVADRAVQIHGGAGYMDEYAVSRFYRDVRAFRIYDGQATVVLPARSNVHVINEIGSMVWERSTSSNSMKLPPWNCTSRFEVPI